MDVIDLLDKLDDLIYQAKPVGFRGQVRVHREDAYALLDQIRVSLPEEIKQADWIVKERRELQREEPGKGGLRAVVDSIDELKRSHRPAPPPLTPAAAEKVCSIIEEAEEVRAEAEREASRLEEDARHRAQETSAQAEAQLRRANDVTGALLQEAGAASAEIDGLLEEVRGPATALAEVLKDRAAALEAEVGRMRAAVDEARAEPSPPAPEDDSEATASPEGGTASAAAGDPDVVFQPTEEWDPVEVMTGGDPVYAEVDPAPEPGEVDPALPGPEAYVHADRLDGVDEPVPEAPAHADSEVDLLEPRPPRFGRWRPAQGGRD
jgi:hypothetical protein